MTADDVMVRFTDVSFGYDPAGPPIVAGVDFVINRGEVVTLLGPSGCGKSTCLNMVAGLLTPRSGTVTFRGRPLAGVNTSVGYMTQEDTLLPWRTVRANVALALKLKGRTGSDVDARIDRYLGMLNLGYAAKKFPAQLSGGMKRRALLARSMVTEPELVLMDEPFAAIDADLREDLQEELRHMTATLSQTVLFVTHDIGEAALVSDRVIVFAGKGTSRIRGTVEVPFGPHRDLEEVRSSEKYFAVQRELRDLLRPDGPRDQQAGVSGPAERSGHA